MKGQLATLRMFLRFCASIDAVSPTLDEKIILPTTTEDNARDEMLDSDRAQKVLDHLSQYRYASLAHTLIAVLWQTGIRLGAARGLDIDDYNPEDQYLAIVHRPDKDTPLKNHANGERLVAVSDRLCGLINAWLDVNHPWVEDEYGREPLFATNDGRVSRTHTRCLTYQATRPCVYDGDCPHNRDPEDCEAMAASKAYGCPSSLSPHPIRRGAITHHLQADTPEPVVSDRMDLGTDVLDRHYDQRTAKEKLRQRRQYLPEN